MNATNENGGRENRSSGSNRSAAELEQEGGEIRADLDRTLDEIERKLSPGELLDRSVEFLRDNGSDMLSEAGETLRRNPVPAFLTAAGLIWLTTSIVKSRSASERGPTDAEDPSSYRRSGWYSSGDYRDGNSSSGVDPRQASTRARQAASKVTRKVKGKLSDSAHALKGRTQGVMNAVHDRTQDTGSRLVALVQEQPIALGALALAAGALLGAALPITPYENRIAGPAHDRALARAKQLGQRGYEKFRESVTSSFAEGRSDTERQRSGGQASSAKASGALGEVSDGSPAQG